MCKGQRAGYSLVGSVREALAECYEEMEEFADDIKKQKEEAKAMREQRELAQEHKRKYGCHRDHGQCCVRVARVTFGSVCFIEDRVVQEI